MPDVPGRAVNALAEALQSMADQERACGARWNMSSLRWSRRGLDELERACRLRAAEHYARAQIYQDWATAVELGVSVDWVRFGCDRAHLVLRSVTLVAHRRWLPGMGSAGTMLPGSW